MWFVAIGALAVVLKLAGITAVAGWSWWTVLSPFAAAALWWTVADTFGITQRNAVLRHEEKVRRRRRKHLESLGMTTTFGPDSRSPRDSRRDRPDSRSR
jgi:small Trp-rich protein